MLGVDGGNSKTIAAVATPAGEIVGVARGGNSDIHGRESPQAALAEIEAVVTAALAEASAAAGDVTASAFSLAGADWPEDFALLEQGLSERLAPLRPTVVNDALGALRLGSPDWTGLAIACGTFNAVAARQADGRAFHFGFWPDQAGGHDLGTKVIKAVYRQGLGLGPATALTPAVLAAYGAHDVIGLIHGFTRLDAQRSMREVRRLAPLLLDTADAGDAVARAIVVEAGEILARQGRVCAERVGLSLEGATLVLTGGVLQHPTRLLEDTITAGLPGVRPIRALQPPLLGALLLAYDAAGREMTLEALARSYARREPAAAS